MIAQEIGLSERVQRLLKSGLCKEESASRHVRELKQLVKTQADDESIKEQSKVLKSLSDPTRLKIIRLLGVRDMCVCEIMAALDLTQPTASHHLNILENAGLLRDRREGKWIFYSLANPDLPKFLEKIHLIVSSHDWNVRRH